MQKRFLKQYKFPWLGGFVESLSLVAFWLSMMNFVMIGGTFYFTTLRFIIPSLPSWGFFLFLIVFVLVFLVINYKFVVPSLWYFRQNQMPGMDEIMRRLEKLENRNSSSN
jgi:uncharacterized membrane protein